MVVRPGASTFVQREISQSSRRFMIITTNKNHQSPTTTFPKGNLLPDPKKIHAISPPALVGNLGIHPVYLLLPRESDRLFCAECGGRRSHDDLLGGGDHVQRRRSSRERKGTMTVPHHPLDERTLEEMETIHKQRAREARETLGTGAGDFDRYVFRRARGTAVRSHNTRLLLYR